MKNTLPLMKFCNIYSVGFFFLIALVYFFSGIFFGLDFTDSFFHINQAIDPSNGAYLYPFFLSTVCLKIIIDLFGPELITLRFLHALFFVLSVLIPFFIVKIPISKTKVLFYATLILVLMAPLNSNILSYDTFTAFMLSLIFSIAVRYLKNPKFYLLIIISLLTAIAVLLRLPNILLIPILLVVVFFQQKKENKPLETKQVLKPLLFLLLSFGTVILVYIIYYQELDVFLSSSVAFSFNDFKSMGYRYLRDGLKLVFFVLFILFSFFVFEKSKSKLKNSVLPYVLFLTLQFLFVTAFVLFSGYSWNYSLFLTALALSFVLVSVYKSPQRYRGFQSSVLLLFVLFMFVHPFGSNTGLLKAYSLFVLFPIVYSISDFKAKKIWLVTLILLLPFSVAEKCYNIYEDKNFFALDETLHFKALYPIQTSKTRVDFLKDTDERVATLQKKNVQVYFYGNNSHIFHYLYPNTDLDLKSFFQPVDDLMFLPNIIKKEIAHNNKVAVFIMNAYPEDIATKDTSLLEKQLIRNDFIKYRCNLVVYYVK